MKKKRMPNLRDTGRHYLEGTQRARLASPGIERHVPAGGGSRLGPVVLALVALAALVGAMLWLR
ncbi:MAG: hypothetical protein QM767_22575 [Anaeromyxobacter sp.]